MRWTRRPIASRNCEFRSAAFVATGKTIDSALRRIGQAIELHFRGMHEDGLKVPAPRHRAVTPRRTSRHVDFYAVVEVVA